MTGGIVVVLGEVGRNFGAGMSGGIAYILDVQHKITSLYNKEMVDMEELSNDDKEVLHMLISRHALFAKSVKAQKILKQWNTYFPLFIKILPKEYKAILEKEKFAKTSQKTQQLENTML